MLNLLKDTIPPQVGIAMLNCHRLALKNKISNDERDELLNAFAFITEAWIIQKETISKLREEFRKDLISKEPENSRHILNREFNRMK